MQSAYLAEYRFLLSSGRQKLKFERQAINNTLTSVCASKNVKSFFSLQNIKFLRLKGLLSYFFGVIKTEIWGNLYTLKMGGNFVEILILFSKYLKLFVHKFVYQISHSRHDHGLLPLCTSSELSLKCHQSRLLARFSTCMFRYFQRNAKSSSNNFCVYFCGIIFFFKMIHLNL